MYVHVNSAELHVALTYEYGLPNPACQNDTELFGPYLLPQGEFWWVWDWGLGHWTVKRSRRAAKGGHLASYTGADPRVEALLDSLSSWPSPAWPDRPESHVDEVHFSYDGWHFKWLMIVEIERWVLVPVGPCC